MRSPAIALLLGLAFCAHAQATIRYVDDSAAAGGDGLSWATASNNLFATLLAAAAGDEIRVGGGIYKPLGASSINTAFFGLHDGMSLRGGYAGYGSVNPDDQNPEAYITTLSGDLNGNDGSPFTNRTDNAIHVVKVTGTGPTCLLDGFTIVGGEAPGFYPDSRGGAVQGLGAVNISRCQLRDNESGDSAGAVFINKGGNLSECTFEGNRATYLAGALQFYNTNLTHVIRRCIFRSNQAINYDGGAVDTSYSLPTFVNCIFAGNSCSPNYRRGGAIHGNYHKVTCINCGFFGNTSSLGGGAIWVEFNATLHGCVFSGNVTTSGAGGAVAGVSEMINCSVTGNQAGTYGGGIQTAYQFTLKNTLLWGNSSGSGTTEQKQIIWDANGPRQVANNSIQGWTGSLGGSNNDGNDPLFRLASGPDAVLGTSDDDLRLTSGSPALDSGDNAALPPDVGDVDGDSDLAELLPYDILRNARVIDEVTAPPAADVVDRGAYETIITPPRVLAWKSLRTHGGGAGPLTIDLDPYASGNATTIEPRIAGVRDVRISFDYPMQLKPGGGASLSVYTTGPDGVPAGPYDYSGFLSLNMVNSSTLRVAISNTILNSCCTMDVSNAVIDASGQAPLGPTSCTFRQLDGDVSASGAVTLSDVLATRVRVVPYPNNVAAAMPAFDVNGSGFIDNTDWLVIKTRVTSPPQRVVCP